MKLKNIYRLFFTLPFTAWLLFIGLNCDFRTPEEWENPSWNWSFTFPLLSKTYPLEDLADSETIFIDTNDVFQIEFSDSLLDEDGERVGIDEDFLSYFTIEDVNIEGINGIEIDPIFFPEEGDSISNISTVEIPITHFSDELIGGNCFPDTLIATGFDTTDVVMENLFSISDFELFESIDYVTIDDGRLSVEVSNTFPFEISLINIEFVSAGETIYTASFADLNGNESNVKIISPEDNESWVNLSENITITWSIIVIPQEGSELEPCDLQLPGWELSPDLSETFEMDISFVLFHSKSVTGTTTADSVSQTTKIELTSESDISIKGGKITDEYISGTLNSLSIDITNNLFAPVDLSVKFRNFFDDFDTLGVETYIEIDENYTSEYTLAGKIMGHPDIEGEVIDSLEVVTTISLPSTQTTIELDNPGSLTIDDFSLSTVELQYVSAITDSLIFDSPETIIEDIPTGFDGFDFVDVRLEIDLYNQIGLPMQLDLNLVGYKNSDSINLKIDPEINYPDIENVNEIGDSVRTIIILNNDGQTVYWLNETGDTLYSEMSETNTTIVDILNFAPDSLSMKGHAIMDGVGVLAPDTYIWGTFELIAPFSFIFDDMTFISEDFTVIDTMEASLRETIDNSLILAELQSKIINHTPMGGVISLLISDSTIFPLYIDSLTTNLITNFNDSIIQDIPDNVSSVVCEKNSEILTSYIEFLDDQDSVLFWIGRLIDFNISPPDSVDFETGIVFEASNFVETVSMDTTQIDWITSEELRYIVPMMTFNSSNGLPKTFLASDSLQITSTIKFVLKVDELFKEDSHSEIEPIPNRVNSNK